MYNDAEYGKQFNKTEAALYVERMMPLIGENDCTITEAGNRFHWVCGGKTVASMTVSADTVVVRSGEPTVTNTYQRSEYKKVAAAIATSIRNTMLDGRPLYYYRDVAVQMVERYLEDTKAHGYVLPHPVIDAIDAYERAALRLKKRMADNSDVLAALKHVQELRAAVAPK